MNVLFKMFVFTAPDDEFTPRKHIQEELDALKIPLDRRDRCKDYYAEFKKCIMVQHQTNSLRKWKTADKENCGYYFDHWNFCRESNSHALGMSNTTSGI